MKMAGLSIILAVIAACVIADSVDLADSVPEYSRSDCIVKFSIDWKSTDGFSLERVNREFGRLVISQELKFDRFPVAGIVYAARQEDHYYVQYADRCGERLKITQDLINELTAQVHPIREFEVFPDRIEPSLQTIDLSGPAWRD